MSWLYGDLVWDAGYPPSLINIQINPFSRYVRLEIMAPDVVWEVVDTICQQALRGDKGEGKIYVLYVVEAVQGVDNVER